MFKIFLAALLTLTSMAAQANLIISGTRVIYPSDQQTVSLQVQNSGDRPALMQSWMEYAPNANDTTQKIPFIITPTIARVEPKSEQSLRIRYTGEPLPKDRETLYYISILDIPAKPNSSKDMNYLQFTFRNYLKFFFRPVNLPYPVDQAYSKVTWNLNGKKLSFENPTPYYITYSAIELLQNDQDNPIYQTTEVDMIAPFSKEVFMMETEVPTATHLRWHVINDYGSTYKGISKLQ